MAPPQTHHLGIEAIAILVVFLIFVGYFVAFEAWWRGSTPGKRALRIRVLRDGAYPVDFMSALIRNAVRSIEFLVGFYTSRPSASSLRRRTNAWATTRRARSSCATGRSKGLVPAPHDGRVAP